MWNHNIIKQNITSNLVQSIIWSKKKITERAVGLEVGGDRGRKVGWTKFEKGWVGNIRRVFIK